MRYGDSQLFDFHTFSNRHHGKLAGPDFTHTAQHGTLSFRNREGNNMPDIDDIVDDIIAWENGGMKRDQEIQFFQKLVDTGLAWHLQGMYGRRAQQLINEGEVHQ